MGAFEDAIGKTGGAPAVDSIWDSVFGQPLGDQESGFTGAAFEPLPRCAYLLKVDAVEAREVGEAKYPTLHFTIRVVKGPGSTVNRVMFDDLFLYPFARKSETAQAAGERLRLTMTRVRNAFRLDQERPMGKSSDAIGLWGRQFEGKVFTGVLRIEGSRKDEETGREYDARNRIVWDSVGHPEAAYTGEEKKYLGKTYAERVDAEIAAFEEKAAGGGVGGAKGKKAGSALGAAKPTDFFGGGSAG
jgi:hypothetical protein